MAGNRTRDTYSSKLIYGSKDVKALTRNIIITRHF